MKKLSSKAFGIICWLVIAILFYATFARLDEENETNTYTYKTTISDVTWEGSNAKRLVFDTNEGMAYYEPHYKIFGIEEVERDTARLKDLSQKSTVVELTITDEKDLPGILYNYKRVVAISTEDEVIFSIDRHNEYNYHRKVFFIIALSICTLFMVLYTWSWAYYERPFRKLERKIKRRIKKHKNKQ
jgi:hypothetical protein